MTASGSSGLPKWARVALTELQRSTRESMRVPSRSKTRRRGDEARDIVLNGNWFGWYKLLCNRRAYAQSDGWRLDAEAVCCGAGSGWGGGGRGCPCKGSVGNDRRSD